VSITFDGASKVIGLTSGTVSLSVRDLWSRWVDWVLTTDNSRLLLAMTVLGGDDIDPAAGTKVPVYVSLINGWRVRPQAANHTLNVSDGVLLVAGGGDPFLDQTGFTVRINYQQPVTAISFATGGGAAVFPTASEIAQAVLSAAQSAPVAADVKKITTTEVTRRANPNAKEASQSFRRTTS
jgi:hypothetical protein